MAESNIVSLLRALIELDLDAIEAYEAAVDKLDNREYRRQLSIFCDEHRRHVSELNPIVQQLGGEPVLQGDFKRVLAKAKVLLGGTIGDRTILLAMKSNEDDTIAAYERAVTHSGVDAATLAILQRAVADERRHRAWIVQTLRASFHERHTTPPIL